MMVSPSIARDFPNIFNRIAHLGWVPFKGAYDEDTLNHRLRKVRKLCRNAAKNAEEDRIKKKYLGRARMYAGLEMGGFAEEYVLRAENYPDSIYAESQKYGFDRAIQIRRAKAEAEMGPLRRVT